MLAGLEFIRSLIYIQFEWCLHWENEFYLEEKKWRPDFFVNSIVSSMSFNFKFYSTEDEI